MKLKFIALVLIAAFLGYAGYWFYLSKNMEGALRHLATDLSETNGISLNYDSYDVSGFPYRLVLTFQKPVMTYHNGPVRVEINAEKMDAILQPWNLSHVIMFPENSFLTLDFDSNTPKHISFKPADFSLSIHEGGDYLLRVSSEMKNVQVESNWGAWVPENLETLAFHLRKFKIDEPSGSTELFEPKILEMALIAHQSETQSFESDLSFHGKGVPKIDRGSLGPWRDQGGTLEVDSMTLKTGRLNLTGSGSFTLDDQFRLLGAVDLAGASRADLVSLFIANGWMGSEQGDAVLKFFDTLPPDTQKEMTKTPLSLSAQDGFLSLGPVRFENIGAILPAQN